MEREILIYMVLSHLFSEQASSWAQVGRAGQIWKWLRIDQCGLGKATLGVLPLVIHPKLLLAYREPATTVAVLIKEPATRVAILIYAIANWMWPSKLSIFCRTIFASWGRVTFFLRGMLGLIERKKKCLISSPETDRNGFSQLIVPHNCWNSVRVYLSFVLSLKIKGWIFLLIENPKKEKHGTLWIFSGIIISLIKVSF